MSFVIFCKKIIFLRRIQDYPKYLPGLQKLFLAKLYFLKSDMNFFYMYIVQKCVGDVGVQLGARDLPANQGNLT